MFGTQVQTYLYPEYLDPDYFIGNKLFGIEAFGIKPGNHYNIAVSLPAGT